jgi:preprotein translocase subunit SecD
VRTRPLVVSIVVILLLVAGSIAGYITGLRPQLGLDLVGGVSVVLEAPVGTPPDVMDRTIELIRARVDALGVAESDLARVGDRSIQVQVPGLGGGKITERAGRFCAVTNAGEDLGCDFRSRDAAEAELESIGQQRLLDQIGRTARLEERRVMETIPYRPTRTELTACPPELVGRPEFPCDDAELVQCPLARLGQPGCRNEDLDQQEVTYLGLEDDTFVASGVGPVEITGAASAGPTAVFRTATTGAPSANIGWAIEFQLTGEGAERFGRVTERLVGQQLAIIVDAEVISAPTIQEAITGGRGEITGSFSEQEAKDLATNLNLGALPVELAKQNVETVSPTLGETSLQQGLIAGIVGLVLLMLYLAFYYRILGVVTWLGMAIWAILSLTLVALMGRAIGYSLTLAGVAGLVVSIGITADSYIVFYERLKDEVRQGKTVRAAVLPAFRRSWRTILAANAVTVLAAAVLYMLAIGSVRGFALTLGVSTALDVFVVYFFKRPVVFLLARSHRLSNLRGFGLRSGVAADPVPAVSGGAE